MRILRSVAELREAVREARFCGARVGLVPTMGALHDGHLSLVAQAREECEFVVMSLFVNPSQFGADEDFDGYPRDERADAERAASAGVDALFAPPAAEVYPEGFATSIRVGGLGDGLCATSRGPEHFRGVATVVCKLLNMAGPDVAYFGQKDAQQSAVIKRLVRDLDFPVRIEICPTVREPDGLAMSSRNSYLQPAERERAAGLSAALTVAEQAVGSGERDAAAVLKLARGTLAARGIEPEYVELVSPETLERVRAVEQPVLLALAAQVGRARLIDNSIIDPRR